MKKGSDGTQIGVLPLLEAMPILCAAAALGGIAGCILAATAGESGITEVASFLSDYIGHAANADIGVSGFDLILPWGQWFVLVLLMEYSLLRPFGLSAILFLHGCVLSFSVSCFVAVFGLPGLGPAFLILGLPSVFFYSGVCLVHWQRKDRCQWPQAKQAPKPEFCVSSGIYLLLFVMTVLLEQFLMVPFLPSAARFAASFHIM